MKTPLTYYGGKQQLADRIIELFPPHRIYVEPFIGGGAVFFQKRPAEVEVINDINSELVNFYEVVKRDFVSLEKKIEISLHSRDLHRKARVIGENPDMFESLDRAWAVWVLANQSFGGMLDGSFGYDRSGTTSQKIASKREAFTVELAMRLQRVQIECADALRIIRSRDTTETLFYCDPPYIGTDMGHYDGYTVEDFQGLLDQMAMIEGKFMLSSFWNVPLQEATSDHGWQVREFEMDKPMSAGKAGYRSRKTEVIVANFPLEKQHTFESGYLFS